MKRLLLLALGCSMLILLSSSTGCNQGKGEAAPAAETEAGQAQEAASDATQAPNSMDQPISKEAQAVIDSVQGTKVRIKTTHGDMIVLLYDETPKHRDNFVKLATEGFYDGLLFHRVINNFMIQGGDPDSRNAPAEKMLGVGGPGYNVDAEIKPQFIHKKGALAAARQGDQMNPQRKSSGSQFYIVQGNKMDRAQLNLVRHLTDAQRDIYAEQGGYPYLDGQYTVFGEVIFGLEVIDKIAAQPTRPGDRPVQDIVMDIDVIK
jgi:peptidyl-prolyl cis-trans isomerase B (cyclophilin B)